MHEPELESRLEQLIRDTAKAKGISKEEAARQLAQELIPQATITVVMAGNHREFLEWCRANGRKPYGRDVRYASSANSLMGMRGIEVVYYGTWHSHPEYARMRGVLERTLASQP